MFKKMLCISLVTGMLLSSTCQGISAQESIQAAYGGDWITVSGMCADCAGERIALMAVRTDTDKTDASGIAALKEIEADADGKFTFVFEMPQELAGKDASGEYAIYTVGKDSHEVLYFEYFNQNGRKDALEILMGAEAQPIMQAFADPVLQKKFKAMGIDTAVFNLLSQENQKAAMDAFVKLEGKKDEKTAVSMMNSCLYIAAYNQEDEREAEFLHKLNPAFEDIDYHGVTDKNLKKWQEEYLHDDKPYRDKEALDQAFGQGYAFYEINHARSAGITGTLKQYQEILELDQLDAYQEYFDLSDVKRGKAAEKLVHLLASKPVKNRSELEAAIKKAIDSLKNDPKPPSGGGGGSASGGMNTGLNEYPGISSGNADQEENKPSEKPQINFTDIEGTPWAKEAIETLAEKGIVAGAGDGRFLPDQAVKREEFAKMIALAGGFGAKGQSLFSDVEPQQWYAGYISALADKQIIMGREDGSFGIGDSITREDMAVIACRAALINGKDLPVIRENRIFSDSWEISAYAQASVERLYGAGIINGMDEAHFMPQGVCTRAQAAKVIYEIFVKA